MAKFVLSLLVASLGALLTQQQCALAVPTAAPSVSCPSSPENACCVPTQILFVVDASQSVPLSDLNTMLNYAKHARTCLFEDGRVQAGLITFERQINLSIPLASHTAASWNAQVDQIKANFAGNNNREFTPMAEALWLARQVFESANSSSACKKFVNRVVVVLTDGIPNQNMVLDSPVGIYGAIPEDWLGVTGYWNNPYTQANVNSNMRIAINYHLNTVPTQAKLLKDLDVRLVIVVLDSDAEETSKNGRLSYYRTGADPALTCAKVASDQGFTASSFCSTRGSLDTQAKRENSQCYRFLQGVRFDQSKFHF